MTDSLTHETAPDAIVSKLSPYSVTETIDRLETLATRNGMRVFARIDQQAAAEAVGLTLRPTELILFGDPRTGTPLMAAHPLLAVDLPLKVLAWQGEDGQVWLSYASPEDLAHRHGLEGDPFAGLHRLTSKALE